MRIQVLQEFNPLLDTFRFCTLASLQVTRTYYIGKDNPGPESRFRAMAEDGTFFSSNDISGYDIAVAKSIADSRYEA